MTKLLGQVKEHRATGAFILVEMLTVQEMANTVIELGVNATMQEPPQAYIVDIGPAVDLKMSGFKVGDRVVIQGKYVPLPKLSGHRERGIVDLYNIKAVLEEE